MSRWQPNGFRFYRRPGGVVGGVAYLFFLLACLTFGHTAPALGLTVTPSVDVGVGHDDNIKLEKDPKSDFFTFVRPQVTLNAGQADDQLTLQGRADYIWYLHHDTESRLQEGSLSAAWRHAFSQTWFLNLSQSWSTTYDAAVLDEFGALSQVRRGGGRHDLNTTNVRTTTLLGPSSQAFLGATISQMTNSDQTSEDMNYYKAEAGLVYRFAPTWRTEARVDAIRDDFQRTDDVNRLNAEATLVRMFDPTSEAFVGASVGTVRSDSMNDLTRLAKDYDVYSAWAGYKDRITPEFGYDFLAGFTHVEADPLYNNAAGKNYPMAKAGVSYRQPLHVLRAYAEMKLGEYDNLGQNYGLTVTQRVGASWQWDLYQHWMFLAQADYIHDDFQQTKFTQGLLPQGNIDSVRLGAVLSYRIARYWKISLDYRYLSRDTEFHTDDIVQNRIMMVVSAEWPQKW